MNNVFLNDKIVDSSNANINCADSGFLYGAGLFETIRCANGKIFAVDKHLKRLFDSAAKLKINIAGDKDFIAESIIKTIEANNLTDARVRLTATNGSISSSEEPKPTLLITATKFQSYPKSYYEKGVLVVLSPCRQNPADGLCGHKTTNYFSRLLALSFAHQQKATEAIWFTVDGRVAEGCVSNLFAVKDNILYTPPLATGVLPGIARGIICDLAAENSIEIQQKDMTIKELLDADEVFLTNVIMQVMGVVNMEAHQFGDGKPGEVTKIISTLFTDYFNKEVGLV